jgi:hypothetical protein
MKIRIEDWDHLDDLNSSLIYFSEDCSFNPGDRFGLI